MEYYIGIPEIIITERYDDTEGRSIRYDAIAAKRPSKCTNPNCKHTSQPYIHDHRPYRLLDVQSEGKIVIIELNISRYRCLDCGEVFPDEFTFFKKRSHLTNRLKQELVKRCINGETYSYIARDYGIDPKTVSSVFDMYWKEHQNEFAVNTTPEYLGIDEAHIDEHYRLVLTDIGGQHLIDIKSNNRKPTVKKYLITLDKTICKAVAMDFAPGYASAVAEALPDATIVIDKFHVIQEINRCVDNVRKDLQCQIKKEEGNSASFYHSRKLFLTNWEDLSEKGFDRLNEWFQKYTDLYEAYMCKETFRDIYNNITDYETAVRMFDMWVDAIPSFERFRAMRHTMSTRREHILNYWKYPVTNAYTESINNRIKAIEKAGRGYKFENLRKRCLMELNTVKSDKFNPSMAEYYSVDGRKAPSRRKKVQKLYSLKINQEKTDKDEISSLKYTNIQKLTSLSEEGDVIPYLECWFIANANHKISFSKRLASYYEQIRQLDKVKTTL